MADILAMFFNVYGFRQNNGQILFQENHTILFFHQNWHPCISHAPQIWRRPNHLSPNFGSLFARPKYRPKGDISDNRTKN